MPSPREGFSLVELLIVIAILAILAAMVFPKYQDFNREASAKSQASNVRLVREMIEVHRHSGLYPLDASGAPAQIHADWFKGSAIPENTWTGAPMVIEISADGADAIYPATKTFDPSSGDPNAWYNSDNGSFCALVIDLGDDAETLALFNVANSTNASGMAQTDR